MFLRSFLNVVENPRSLPTFLGVYVLFWLLWHHQFLLNIGAVSGGIFERIHTAIVLENSFQYILVLGLTIVFFVFQFSFKSFVKSSREYVDKVDREQNDPLSESIKHNDIEQLVLVLESLQNEIALSKANEKKAKVQVKEIMKKSLILQTKLDEVTADFEILKATK
tara:strand:- start:2306 stop:2803 length:498 start_codon:yes stop_codon:yes gene_type:complete